MQSLAAYSSRVVTSEFVLLKVANFNARPADRQRFVDLTAQIGKDSQTQLIPASSDPLARGIDLFAQHLDKYWSVTNCTSFIVMSDQKLTEILIADAHFEQAGFRMLLKPEVGRNMSSMRRVLGPATERH